MRILFITNTPPIPSWGGAMTFYRHFCERNDFTISVITNDKQVNKYKVPYPYLLIEHGKLFNRLRSSRFHLLMETLDRMFGYWPIPKNVIEHAAEFKPDAIFTVAGSWQGMAILAQSVAKKLNVPLIGSFNDWWDYSATFHPKAGKLIESKFRDFYKECDLAICTSEGMKAELGERKNAIILYPTGAAIKERIEFVPKEDEETFTVSFGGSLADWYGKMMEQLVTVAKGSNIKFKIFGGNPSWSKSFDEYVKSEGIYKGLIPFEQLQEEMKSVDGLLLLMGFDESCAMVEKTSFKTKFLDYLTFQKPIMLWGPTYCSAVSIAREFRSAEISTSPDPLDFFNIILNVKDNSALQRQLVKNAGNMYDQRFNPDILHQKLLKGIKGLKSA